MNFIYYKATIADLDILLDTRIRTLRSIFEFDDTVNMDFCREQNKKYYLESLANESHIAYLVFYDKQIIGNGGICFYRTLPTMYDCRNGYCSTIVNLYVEPAYRRQGIGKKLLHILVAEAKKKGVSQINLDATDVGKPLYQSYGFVPALDIMNLPPEFLDL